MVFESLVSALGPALIYIVLGSTIPPAWRFATVWAARALWFVCIPLVVFKTAYTTDTKAVITIAILSFAVSCLAAGLSLAVPSRTYIKSAKAVLFGYFNIGWFGIPIAHALFGPAGTVVMTSAYIGGLFFGATLGIYLIASTRYRPSRSIVKVLRNPAFYMLVLGFVLKKRLEPGFMDSVIFDAASVLTSFFGMALIGAVIRRHARSMWGLGRIVGLLAMRQLVSVTAVGLVVFVALKLSMIDWDQARIFALIAIFPIAANIIVMIETLKIDAESLMLALIGSTMPAFVLVGVAVTVFGSGLGSVTVDYGGPYLSSPGDRRHQTVCCEVMRAGEAEAGLMGERQLRVGFDRIEQKPVLAPARTIRLPDHDAKSTIRQIGHQPEA